MRPLILPALALGLAIGTPVAATPRKVVHPGPQLSAAEKAARLTMAKELRRGRQLERQGKHTEAVAAFDAALAAAPDEPRVLLDLGLALRLAGDLPRAETVCRKVTKPGTEPVVLAPGLYNLGRVLEEKGDKPGAIAAYRESLRLRENRIVRERLVDLDPTAQSDATRPAPLAGPFPTLEAWCAANPDEPCHLDDEAAVHVRLAKPAPPWLDARVFTTGADTQDCVLGLRTARGWYVDQLETCRDGEFRGGVSVELTAADMLEGPGAPGPEIVVTLGGTDAMKDYDEEAGHSVCCLEAEFSSLALCGLGPSQVPSCTPTIDLLPPLEAKPQGGDVGLAPSYSGDELSLVRIDGKPPEARKPTLHPSLRAISGRHRIAFP